MRRVLLASALLLAPGSAHAAEPPAHRVRGDLAIRARDIFQRYCSECHTGGDAPGLSKLKLMDHAKVTGKKAPVPLVSASGRSQIIELVKDGSMPPANRPGPTADEIATLEKWVKADAPEYPLAFDEPYTLNALADDFEQESARIKDGTAGEVVRYVSFAHLIRDGQPLPDLLGAEERLNAAVTAVTGLRIAPEPVDVTATLFRIDTNKLGWRACAVLFEKWENRKEAGAVRLQPFDLLLMEYPHAQVFPPNELRKKLDKLLSPTSQLRSVPHVRGDWLTAALLDGQSLTPLAEDFKSLVALEKAFERKAEVEPDGPVAKPFAGAKSVAVPAAADGRTPIPPLSAWYAGDVTPEKPPFTLTAEIVSKDKVVTELKGDDTFTIHVESDRKVQFVLLKIDQDGEVKVQEVVGGTTLLPKKKRVLATDEGSFSITGVLKNDAAATEHFVLFACETELPLPTIIRSKHADKHVWRFLMEPTETDRFDPNTVVRKVIPIKVTKK